MINIVKIGILLAGVCCVSLRGSLFKHLLSKRQFTTNALVCIAESQKALIPYDLSLLQAADRADVMEVTGLILLGADLDRRDPLTGDTALHCAVASKNSGHMWCSPIHTVHTLLFAGASAQAINNAGHKPIDYATNYQIRAILCRTYPRVIKTDKYKI